MKRCLRCGYSMASGESRCIRCGAEYKFSDGGGKSGNIFSALAGNRTSGVIMEFALWCVICVIILMSLIAAIVGQGNVTWIFMMLFSVGLGVLMAFRLKAIAMLYSICTFNFLLPIVHYACFAKPISDFGMLGYYNYAYSSAEYSPLNITLFVIALILSIILVMLGFIFHFTRARLENTMTILVIVDCGVTIFLQIFMYACPSLGTYVGEIYNECVRSFANYNGYWMGTITFWFALIVVMMLYIFFFWGSIDSSVKRIRDMFTPGYPDSESRVLKGICGTYAGYEIPLNGREILVGSGDKVQIKVADPHVSRVHCSIRYNRISGLYEIKDMSLNGVYLTTGFRLKKDSYSQVNRGSIICIGSQSQQFRLM